MSIATGNSAVLFYLLPLLNTFDKEGKYKKENSMPSAVILPFSKTLNIDSCGCVHKSEIPVKDLL